MSSTIQAAQGKWSGILSQFGIDSAHLRNVHGPCPLCGGNDRYRFDDKDGTGSFYCNQCGAGNGMDLLMKYKGWDFRTAANEIDRIVGKVESKPAQKHDTEKARKRINWILSTLDRQHGINPVRLYLRSRQLPNCKALEYHPGVKYYHDGEFLGAFPAMVAKFTDPDGKGVTLHLTHLTEKGEKANVPAVKKILSPLGKMNGGAIRLTDIYKHLGIAEGIETAIAVMRDFKMPCWATANATLMADFIPPQGVEEITIFGDNDESFTGQAAAYKLANRLHQNYKVNVILPDSVGDFADREGRG